MALILTACGKVGESELMSKVGFVPYDLSEKGSALLQAFDIKENADILPFAPPKTQKVSKCRFIP